MSCYSNCPYEIRGGDNWGDCGKEKMQGTPLAHCYEEPEEEDEEEEKPAANGLNLKHQTGGSMSEKLTEIKTFTPEQLQEILAAHKKWLNDEEGGARANLEDANLEDANLTRANLEDANLYGANLTRANLYGANLTRAKYGEDTLRGFFQVGPIGSRKSMLQVFGIGAEGFVFRAGCFTGNLKEFSAKVINEHGENQHAVTYLAAIEFAKVMLPTAAAAVQEVAE